MFEGLSHGSQSYCNRAILSTKLINAGLYVFCKVNDNGTTAKPAGCGWLLTFTEQTHVNVLKYRINTFRPSDLLSPISDILLLQTAYRWHISYLPVPGPAYYTQVQEHDPLDVLYAVTSRP